MEFEGRTSERGKPCPTDLTYEPWESLEPLVPAPELGPQPAKLSVGDGVVTAELRCRAFAPPLPSMFPPLSASPRARGLEMPR